MSNIISKLNKYFILILAVLIVLIIPKKSLADVGSFESYDSDSSYDSDWSSSSSWDDDYDYGYSSSSSSSDSLDFPEVMVVLIIFLIIYAVIKSKKDDGRRPPINNYQNIETKPKYEQQENIEEKVKAIDELFNQEEFLAWVKDLFVKLQEAWTARDWSTIRYFESNELFEQHQKQLQGYIDNHQINKMERICVKSAELSKFEQSGDKDILTITLSSKMVDYIIDDRTEEIIKGDKTTDRHSIYKLVFIRKTGVKTKEKTNTVNTTNCPNCGAPTKIGSSGKCDYCGSVITTGEFNWVLSNLEKIG